MNSNSTSLANPVPLTQAELIAARRISPIRTLNDVLDDLVVSIWESEKYQKLINAVYDSEAVEGSLSADNYEAARFLRELAKEKGIDKVANQNLATINMAHGVVLRRYGFSRNQRRNTVHGQPVPNGNGDDSGQ